MGGSPAAAIALELVRVPSRLKQARAAPVPADVLVLLRIVAGDADALEEALRQTASEPAALKEAAEFFVEQALFFPEANGYRVLGASAAASSGELRRNMALLLRWLHPDLHRTSERSVFAHRVTEAWEQLKTPDRRAAYDEALRFQIAASGQAVRLPMHVRPYPGVHSSRTPRGAGSLAQRLAWQLGRLLRRRA